MKNRELKKQLAAFERSMPIYLSASEVMPRGKDVVVAKGFAIDDEDAWFYREDNLISDLPDTAEEFTKEFVIEALQSQFPSANCSEWVKGPYVVIASAGPH